MSQAPQPQVVIVQSNGVGTAGFILSLVGFITCGCLSPVGLFFSLLGINKQPRGLAIAGTVLGGMGSLWLLVFTFPFFMRWTEINDAPDEQQEVIEQQETPEEKAIREETERQFKSLVRPREQ